MTDSNNKKSILNNMPSNYGYIINDNKHYGKCIQVKKEHNVKVIGDNNDIHFWSRSIYHNKKINKTETDSDGWTTVNKRIITSRNMSPCQEEINNKGKCSKRNDTEHCKYFYHFTSYRNGHITIKDGLVRCKYDKNNTNNFQCWEKYNGKHAMVFYHGN